MAKLLQKVAFVSGKIIFESIVILAQCKLYTHTHAHTHIFIYLCIDVLSGMLIKVSGSISPRISF